MRKHHPDNERVKRAYFSFLKEAKRQSEASVDAAAKAISRFESYTGWRDFKTFRSEQATAFKSHLGKQPNEQTGKPLSKATLNTTLRSLKAFFQWLALRPGYKSRINYTDTEYFNLSEKDVRVATARRERPVATLEQIHHVLELMPSKTPWERRDRALVAFTLLTGARDSAIASLKIKHVDLDAGSIFQDAREVNTKASKTFTSFFFPVGGVARETVEIWIYYLRRDLLFGLDDPVFPKTEIQAGDDREFKPSGLSREHWSSAAPIRRVFRDAFALAELPYFNPQSFRNTLVTLGQSVCGSPEEFKAWSQNLGHSSVMTTLVSYGEVQTARQGDILRELHGSKEEQHATQFRILAEAVARHLGNDEVSQR